MTPQSPDTTVLKCRSRRVLLIALAVMMMFVASRAGSYRPPLRPNVLLLVMDTTRADRCSFSGYARPTTPRLAELAGESTVFLDAWTPGSWTGPAHASLFTGLCPQHHGFHDGGRWYLDDDHRTLAQLLRAEGYATASFSSNGVIAPAFGLTRGCAEVFVTKAGTGQSQDWLTEHVHDLAATFAEREAAAGRPFYLFINDMEPHLPLEPTSDLAAKFVRGAPSEEELAAARAYDFPRTLSYTLGAEDLSARQIDILSDLYDAEIAALDHRIGVLLDRFRASGLLDSTIVVITSDHGELLGEHHMLEHGFSLHRAVTHVPLLVRWPAAFECGRRETRLVRLEDVMPTVLELCHVTVPEGLDGTTLTSGLDGRVARGFHGANPGRRSWFEAVVPGADVAPLIAGIESVYDGRFHELRYTDGRAERYDVLNDPGECVDLMLRACTGVERAMSPRPR